MGRALAAVWAEPGAVAAALEAAFAGGPAVLPLDQALPAAARQRLLDAARPVSLIDAGGVPRGLPDPRPVPDDVVLAIATSGSTGEPRLVLLGAAALAHGVAAGLARTQADPAIPWLCALPVAHVAGVLCLLRARHQGTAPLLAAPGLAALPQQQVHAAFVPTQLASLVAAGIPGSRFGVVLLGGAPASPELLAAARTAGYRLTLTYGMTESAGGCVYDGIPLDGVEAAVDTGLIRLRGPVLASALRTAAADTPLVADDGWYLTSDLGRLRADGVLEVLGRADDVAVTGGHNVVTGAVAALLEGHPAVTAAAVVGQPDPQWGTRLVAVVVPHGAAPTLAALQAHVAHALPRHALPRALVIVPALPRLPGGKVDRAAVTRLAASPGTRR